MNVVFIAPFGFSSKNTTGRRLLPMARAIVAEGHRARVLVPPYDEPSLYGKAWEDSGVEVCCLNRPRFAGGSLPAQMWTQYRLAHASAKLVEEWAPDLVHVFKPKAVSGLAQLFISLQSVRPGIVLDLDDWEGRGGWSANEDYSRLLVEIFDVQERFGMRRCDAFTAASRTLAARALGVADGREVLHIPNGFDQSVYAGWNLGRAFAERDVFRRSIGLSQSDRLVLIYTRFFDYDISSWVELIRSIASGSRTTKFLVLGAGKFGQEKYLSDAVRDHGLSSRITFMGWTQFQGLPSPLAASDIALMPMADNLANQAKCSPRFVDLMYAGVPIVTTRVGEVSTFITDGFTGYVSESDQPASVAAAALRALDDSEVGNVREQARSRACEDLSWRSFTASLPDLYECAVKRAGMV
jgi:glycosyltransferase involved in cell wall biosynthesis